ncbi:tyrosine-type recombinase/integrase [Streptococcus pneumoniae]|nr:tyrosine-type recombinase/integrase [Streptococcus pneumoniae]MDG7113437.1 tyrosine-type recombinase/integrase [Streptococcus pneumoniae]MDG7199929.1 tyrosine-type recombinase/integrase [Streptococcus pneumoniae]MDG9060475.1 tyrosine-type recombinase/integrase [Streptococcus pneumoniae]MDG9394080.1 tyrosine-type recombinase/integrase [Streptococcus pneumoniae]
MSLLLSTGIRISELCHIHLKDINLSNKTLHIIGKGEERAYPIFRRSNDLQFIRNIYK